MPTLPKEPLQDEEAFLSRWSRRKRTEPVETTADEAHAEPTEEMTDEEILAELDLPDPDAMKADDDFSAFMQARVPERLRRRALRVLWRSNPVLANLDELVDYGEDYTDAATVMENMQTVYEVGKGAAEKWKRHMAALAAAAEDEEEASETPQTAEAEQKTEQAAPVAALPDPSPVIPEPIPVYTLSPEAPPPRHMRFSFD